jgi:L-xylulokinase
VAADLFLGVDIGNTIVKAVLFDPAGRQMARHGVDGTSLHPGPGMVERPVAELWANARTAIAGCLAAAGVPPGRIAAVGLSGHGNGLYLLDRDKRPLIGIQSLDTRAASHAADLERTAGEALHGICLQRPWPAQTPVLLSWLKRNRPEIYRQAGTLLFAKDVVAYHLTGRIGSEISDMSGAGLLRLPSADYDAGLLAHYGLDDAVDLLPPLERPEALVGAVTAEAAAATGLAEGTPVAAGYFDVIASALGSGASGEGAASVVLGSWSINQVFGRSPLVDPGLFMVAAFGPDRFASMDNSATSAANLEWYARTLIERGGHPEDPFGAVNALVRRRKVEGSDPLFHPFLYGGREGAHQRAGFFGVAGWHDEGHLLRALFEGVAFEHRRHLDRLRAAGATLAGLTLSGGGTRSPVWPQMMANVLDLDLAIGDAEETGALGAVMAAAVGIGRFPDIEAAVATMTRRRTLVVPDAEGVRVAERRYALWSRMVVAFDAGWRELEALGERGA